MVDPLVDLPLGNFDDSSILFSVKIVFKITNITFSQKSRVGDDLSNFNWNVVYNSPNPVSEFNKVITSLIDRRVSSKIIRRRVNDKALFNKDCVNAFYNKQNAYRL